MPAPNRDEVLRNLDRFVNNLHERLDFLVMVTAAQAQEDMKVQAPWTDRTGNARASLMVTHNTVGSGPKRLVFSGGMWYSPILERRVGGRYAIIWPSALRFAGRLMEDIRAVGITL